LPADFLAGLDEEARVAQWMTRIGIAAWPDSPTFVALDEARTLCGFTHTGPVRDGELAGGDRAEVYTIYVDPASWRRGIGTALMDAVDDFWRPRGIRELVLWAFEGNADGRAFYERLGWQPDGARVIDDFGGVKVAEVRFRRSI
jgi:GNAT superfamily N-acetyltransferase